MVELTRHLSAQPATAGLHGLAQRIVLSRLERLRCGRLRVVLPDGSERLFTGTEEGPTGHLEVHHARTFARMIRSSDIGAGEAYMAGEWSSPDPVALIRLLLRNKAVFAASPWTGWITRMVNLARHWSRANTRAQAKKNIAAHYDLSNEFYRLFLDPSMTYSSALFARPGMSLETAQQAKYEAMADAVGLQPGMRVLEIGCGWGGFAELATRRGCHVTGLTLSENQAFYARQRLESQGLGELADIRIQDYRDVKGTYDAIVSIEMLEAVGHRFFGPFFATCERTLRRGGRVALQVITMPDARYQAYRRGTDWIRAYVFPGGHLPAVGALQRAASAESEFDLFSVRDMGLDYAETLRQWRQRFQDAREWVSALGFDDVFQRLWDFYLLTCEAAFAERNITVRQLVFARMNEDLKIRSAYPRTEIGR
jgi:cyclopropane-fatty-acyl-phospholipid synthase